MNQIEVTPELLARSDRLEEILRARFALEHARRRRSYLAHGSAAAGLAVWLYAMGAMPSMRILVLGSSAVLFAGLVISLVAELYDWARLARAVRGGNGAPTYRTPLDD